MYGAARRSYRDLGTSTRSTALTNARGRILCPTFPGPPQAFWNLKSFLKRIVLRAHNQSDYYRRRKQAVSGVSLRTRTEDGASTTGVIVKLAVNYNTTAHRLLVTHKPPLAIALQSYTRVTGDTVVMEHLPGATLLGVLMPLPASVMKQSSGTSLGLSRYSWMGLHFWWPPGGKFAALAGGWWSCPCQFSQRRSR